jgi:hypothetical protein
MTCKQVTMHDFTVTNVLALVDQFHDRQGHLTFLYWASWTTCLPCKSTLKCQSIRITRAVQKMNESMISRIWIEMNHSCDIFRVRKATLGVCVCVCVCARASEGGGKRALAGSVSFGTHFTFLPSIKKSELYILKLSCLFAIILHSSLPVLLSALHTHTQGHDQQT